MRISPSLIVVTMFCYNTAYAASCKPGYELRHAYPKDHTCITHKAAKQRAKKQAIKHKTHKPVAKTAIQKGQATPVAEESQTTKAGPSPCKPGYEPRLAQPDDFTCVSHHVAERTANENATAMVNGKPNPMTTNLNLSCKKPDYFPRKATPTDNVCVSRASSAQARVDNDKEAH